MKVFITSIGLLATLIGVAACNSSTSNRDGQGDSAKLTDSNIFTDTLAKDTTVMDSSVLDTSMPIIPKP